MPKLKQSENLKPYSSNPMLVWAGGNHLSGCRDGIVLGLNILSGDANVVSGNTVEGSEQACNFTNARETVARDNAPASCDT